MSYILCSECKVTLRCVKNEKVVRMGGAEIKWGDEYKCPKCGIMVITGFGSSLMPWDVHYAEHVPEIEVEGAYD